MKNQIRKTIILCLALLMVMAMATTANAAPAPVRNGLYIQLQAPLAAPGLSAPGPLYLYYNNAMIKQNRVALETFVTANNLQNNTIRVNEHQEYYKPQVDPNAVPQPVTNIVGVLGSDTYYDVKKGENFTLVFSVEPTLGSGQPTRSGFNLHLSKAITDLDAIDLHLKDSAGADVNTITGITKTDNQNYAVAAALVPGNTYYLTVAKAGWDFGINAVEIAVPTETIQLAATPVTDISATGFTLHLAAPNPNLTKNSFSLDGSGVTAAITNMGSSDGGSTYVVTAAMTGGVSYNLTCRGKEFQLSNSVTIPVPAISVTGLVTNFTVTGFTLGLTPVTAGLDYTNFKLEEEGTNNPVQFTVTPSGSNYNFSAALNGGVNYKLTITKKGYNFTNSPITGLTPAITPITVSVNTVNNTDTFSITITGTVDGGLGAADFELKDPNGAPIGFKVSHPAEDTYTFITNLQAGVNNTLVIRKNGYSFNSGADIIVKAPVKMAGVTVSNGSVVVNMNGVPEITPTIGNFTIKRSINAGLEQTIVPSAITWDSVSHIATLTVSQVSATGVDQVVTGKVTYGGIDKEYSFTVFSSPNYVAANAAITAPPQDAVLLTLPTMPAGFTAAIKSSSNTGVIALNGTITPPSVDTTVTLVLTITKTATGQTADTGNINVVVPGSPTAVANGITSITNPAAGVTTLTLPAVPNGYTIAIKQSTNTGIIALDRTISPKFSAQQVQLILEVTKTSNSTKHETISITVTVPTLPAATTLNTATTAAQVQSALTALGLDLSAYNTLDLTQKGTVAQAILDNRPTPGGYTDKAAIQAAINLAINTAIAAAQDKDAVAAAKALLDIGYIPGDSITSVTQNLTLAPSSGGVTIIWTSDNQSIISNTGTVIRPSYTAGNATVKLTANLSKNLAADMKEFTITVLKASQTAAEVAATITAITTPPAKDAVTLTLPEVPAGYSIAIKTSYNTAVIAANGTITPPVNTTSVALVLEVTRTSDSTVANTATINVVVPAKTPGAPTGLTALAGDGQVKLSWTIVPGATSYKVYKSTESGLNYTEVAPGTTKSTLSYTVTGLTNGTTYYFVVKASSAAGGDSVYSSEATALPKSIDARLSGITFSSGTLTPSFASAVTSYTISVGSAVTSLTVTPTASESHAVIKINQVVGNTKTIDLIVGANIITVEVTAQDGITKKAYTITVNRALAAPSVTANDDTNVIVGIDAAMEYQIDSGLWVSYDAANLPDLAGSHTVLVRVKASGLTPAGQTASLTFTTNADDVFALAASKLAIIYGYLDAGDKTIISNVKTALNGLTDAQLDGVITPLLTPQAVAKFNSEVEAKASLRTFTKGLGDIYYSTDENNLTEILRKFKNDNIGLFTTLFGDGISPTNIIDLLIDAKAELPTVIKNGEQDPLTLFTMSNANIIDLWPDYAKTAILNVIATPDYNDFHGRLSAINWTADMLIDQQKALGSLIDSNSDTEIILGKAYIRSQTVKVSGETVLTAGSPTIGSTYYNITIMGIGAQSAAVKVKWYSSNTSAASFDSDFYRNKLTAHGAGTTEIRAYRDVTGSTPQNDWILKFTVTVAP